LSAATGAFSRLDFVTISLARGIPAPECLPVEELAECAEAALRRDGRTILSYGSTLGYEPLREWIAARHGVAADRVVVTNGSLQVFHLLLSALPAGRVIVERPTYDRPRKILLEEGRELGEVPVGANGMDVDDLERVHGEGGPVALLYTIPTFQNPTGITLSEDGRRRLVALAGERALTVLEDDPYGLVRFDGEPLPTIFELEGGERVMYSSSFSKTIAPGLRVGYAIVPAALASRLELRAAATYITPGLLAQATVHEFLRRGLLESSLERVRVLLRERRVAMLEALERTLAGRAAWTEPEGGYFVWLELPDDVDGATLLRRAREAGVTFVPGTDFGGEPNTARLAFSFVTPAEIAEGVARLAKLVTAAPAPA
jgi:DNA-binding transcriptional MocR family regulator